MQMFHVHFCTPQGDIGLISKTSVFTSKVNDIPLVRVTVPTNKKKENMTNTSKSIKKKQQLLLQYYSVFPLLIPLSNFILPAFLYVPMKT